MRLGRLIIYFILYMDLIRPHFEDDLASSLFTSSSANESSSVAIYEALTEILVGNFTQVKYHYLIPYNNSYFHLNLKTH